MSEWVQKIGFGEYGTEKIVQEYKLDGDILLSLDESELMETLRVDNAILRKRFQRELNCLKVNADYSQVDPHKAIEMIQRSGQKELLAYAYKLKDIKPGVLRSGMDETKLDNHLKDYCHITSTVHRQAIVEIYRDNTEKLSLSSVKRQVWPLHTILPLLPFAATTPSPAHLSKALSDYQQDAM